MQSGVLPFRPFHSSAVDAGRGLPRPQVGRSSCPSRTSARPCIIAWMSLRSEIAEQPAAVARLLDEGAAEARRLGALLGRANHLTVAARGSSDNAATYGKYLFEGLARIVTASAAPS